MAKTKSNRGNGAPSQPKASEPIMSDQVDALYLISHPMLGYKLRVLLYDLLNFRKDPLAEQRVQSSMDELYIGEPYFSAEESATIKTAKVDVVPGQDDDDDDDDENPQADLPTTATIETTTVERAIQAKLCNFLEKRKASGDARPCGPHDLFPIYASVFGVAKEELQDEKFLSRLRRCGLGDRGEPSRNPLTTTSDAKVKGKKKGKKN